MASLSVIEICAGAGGQSLGLEKAGFQHKLAVELNPDAVATLKRNRPKWDVKCGDVADRTIWDPAKYSPASDNGQTDLFAGGVPCPPFSIAGKRLGADDERDLFAWAVEQTPVIQPRAVLLENVRGLSTPRFAGYRQHVLDRFREFGYSAEWQMIHASTFGVPQLRPRFVLVAMPHEYFEHFHWPIAVPGKSALTVGETLRSLMAAGRWEGAAEWADKANGIAPTIVGGSMKHGGADLGPTGAKRAWAKLGVDGHGVADHPPGPGARFEVGPRLTCEMVARLQGWGSKEFRWKFEGKKTSTYRQIGNAFPPPVAKALGVAIKAAINKTVEPETRQVEAAHDPIYRVLRDDSGHVLASELAYRSGLSLNARDVEWHITRLRRDFHIDEVNTLDGPAYRLGDFRAFVGQPEHARHEHFPARKPKVSR
ncbi:DNA (cytosine-5-)-methyltransferase [Rhodococcus jostii]|uniref:Cytosine-specific methyltransferase n=1 Tax=Rhodococcus jostii TaxID=132919 RepID=A0ABU4CD61_RHOJO|nr:DNA (cytosine-5-)-methyltransferase [Rhodococcus jostii]MDV6281499.1 DNA (cytosine-5-)-methyltransferase [Rhodococcus jostii]